MKKKKQILITIEPEIDKKLVNYVKRIGAKKSTVINKLLKDFFRRDKK